MSRVVAEASFADCEVDYPCDVCGCQLAGQETFTGTLEDDEGTEIASAHGSYFCTKACLRSFLIASPDAEVS